MICDGAKMVSLREKLAFMTQEKLADLAKVDRRTVQRMEAGESVSGESVNQVAAQLGVTSSELLRKSDEHYDDTVEAAGILLKSESSGIRLVRAIITADELDFGVAFEPWPGQVEVVRPLLRFLEELHPHTFQSIYEYDRDLQRSAARQIEAAAKANAGLAELAKLKPEGLHILSGQYTRWGQRWHWDNDEGCWSVHLKQRDEVLTVMALRIAPVSTTGLRIPLLGERPPLPSLDDDEVPF
jgi:transcriptional regulator with XRE-family HTH domain